MLQRLRTMDSTDRIPHSFGLASPCTNQHSPGCVYEHRKSPNPHQGGVLEGAKADPGQPLLLAHRGSPLSQGRIPHRTWASVSDKIPSPSTSSSGCVCSSAIDTLQTQEGWQAIQVLAVPFATLGTLKSMKQNLRGDQPWCPRFSASTLRGANI